MNVGEIFSFVSGNVRNTKTISELLWNLMICNIVPNYARNLNGNHKKKTFHIVQIIVCSFSKLRQSHRSCFLRDQNTSGMILFFANDLISASIGVSGAASCFLAAKWVSVRWIPVWSNKHFMRPASDVDNKLTRHIGGEFCSVVLFIEFTMSWTTSSGGLGMSDARHF